MSRTRTFVAVETTPQVRSRAADLANRLRASQAKVTWVAPHNMHLTLKFLGDVADTRLAKVCQAVADACAAAAPFEIEYYGAGAFPDTRRPRTLWIGLRRGADELETLHQTVETTLARLGFPKEGRRFHPHLTIGRVRTAGSAAKQLGEQIESNHEFPVASMRVAELVVFASTLHENGPCYQPLGRAPLMG